MKKLMCYLLTAVLLLSLCACGEEVPHYDSASAMREALVDVWTDADGRYQMTLEDQSVKIIFRDDRYRDVRYLISNDLEWDFENATILLLDAEEEICVSEGGNALEHGGILYYRGGELVEKPADDGVEDYGENLTHKDIVAYVNAYLDDLGAPRATTATSKSGDGAGEELFNFTFLSGLVHVQVTEVYGTVENVMVFAFLSEMMSATGSTAEEAIAGARGMVTVPFGICENVTNHSTSMDWHDEQIGKNLKSDTAGYVSEYHTGDWDYTFIVNQTMVILTAVAA